MFRTSAFTFKYQLLIFFIIVLTGCKKEFVEGYAEDPNRPIDVPLNVLLPGAQIHSVYVSAGDLNRITNVIMQQMTGADRSYLGIDRYVIAGSEFETLWTFNAYAGGMKDLSIMMQKAQASDSPHYQGVAEILMALNLGTLTDAFGDVPYSDALLGNLDSGLEPVYDSQESVYNAMLDLLDVGIEHVNSTASVLTPSDDDYFFNGDMSLWSKFAYTLRARYLNRLSNKENLDPEILEAVANGFTANEGCLPTFGSAQLQSNPWGNFLVQREGYLIFEGNLMDGMTFRNDSLRREVFQDLEGFYFQFTSPVVLTHHFELAFIEAETMLRQQINDTEIQTKLEEAVSSHFMMLGLNPQNYLENDLVQLSDLDSDAEKLEAIIWEKYVATYTMNEAWNDYRRTGFPELIPNINAQGGIDVPQRMPYPQSEYLYNGNTPSAVENFPASLTTPVWWAE